MNLRLRQVAGMKQTPFFLIAGIILLLGWGTAEGKKSLYLPLMLKNKCTEFVFLAYGDSITAGYGATVFPYDLYSIPHSGYVGRLYEDLKALYPKQDLVFYNMGIGGQTTDVGLDLFTSTITEPLQTCHYDSGCIYPRTHPEVAPKLILIMEGTNDLNQGVSYEELDNHLRSMVAIAQQQGMKVVIGTIPPVCGTLNSLQQRIEGFRPWIYQIARDFNIPLADVFGYFVSTPNWETTLLSTDPILGCEHPNDPGYVVMKQAFLDEIKPWMTADGCYTSPY
jgi:lysophospholipase L1-like esterase